MLKIMGLFVLLCAACHVALSFTDGLLANGGFESGPLPLQSRDSKSPEISDVPDWEFSGFVELVKSGQTQGDMVFIVPEGNYAIRLGSNSAIKQKVTVDKGNFYSITFSAARTCGQNIFLNVSVLPNSKFGDFGILPIQTMYSSLGWDLYSWAFVAESDNIVITIQNPAMDKDDMGCGPIIDTIALKILHNPKRTRADMLKNGDFEQGPYIIPNTSVGVLIPPNIQDDHSPLPGWIIESLKAVKYIDIDHFTVPEGKRAIELVGGLESSIAQIVPTQPGKRYVLSFSIGDANNKCVGSFVVKTFAGEAMVSVGYESKGKGGFERAWFEFRANLNRTRVRFLSSKYFMKNDYSGSLCGPVVDDVKMIGVREVYANGLIE